MTNQDETDAAFSAWLDSNILAVLLDCKTTESVRTLKLAFLAGAAHGAELAAKVCREHFYGKPNV